MRHTPFVNFDRVDITTLLADLTTHGVTSIPLLHENARLALLQEAEAYSYRPEIGIVGSGDRIVRQEYSSCETFPLSSLYFQLKDEFQACLTHALTQIPPSPFATPLHFNSMVLQRYEPGQLGISPHRDSLRSINLICIFNIGGNADFYRCLDRQGRHSIAIDTTPGNVIFMRAPGFQHSTLRPFHYLTNVRSTRYSFGLRQIKQ